MFLRCSTFAVSTFCLFTGFPALTQVVPAPKRCASVTSAELAAMQQYLTAKFRLSAPPEISIAEVQQDCFTRLTVSLQGVGHQERRVPLYLAPDHRYLFPDVFDLEISPQVAERREAKRLKHLVIPGSHPIVGSASSPVQIVVYSDFGCPHCATLWRTLKPYVENRAGAIAMAFRSCPIDQLHPWARSAAIASKCAEKQGSDYFISLSDFIFERQGDITPANLATLLSQHMREQPGFRMDSFERCIVSRATEADVLADERSASEARVAAIPTVFINGRGISGAASAARLAAVIAEAQTEID